MKSETKHHKKVIDYFKKSKLGYDIVLWGAKHFGFYPSTKKDISEKRAQELMQGLLAKNLEINKKQLILDAGCGQGVVSTYLAKKYGCKIIGITIVPFEVDKANTLAKELGVSKMVEYHLMDYSNTTFRDNQFDSVYTMEAFVHSPTPKKTLREFFRILKPGGRLVMFEYTIVDDSKLTKREKKLSDMIIEGSAMGALKSMRHNSFPKTLKGVGFESVMEQNITQNIIPSFERLYKLARMPYFFVKLFRLQKHFINLTAAVESFKPIKRGLMRYCIFTAKKPRQ